MDIRKIIETPALIIDYKQVLDNLKWVQNLANSKNVKLRPHTKTHKMPFFARKQVDEGAVGIAVAKVGEAEVMARGGIKNILIANEIVGIGKYKRIRALEDIAEVMVGIDNKIQVEQISRVFSKESPLKVLIELEVGECRSGIVTQDQLRDLVEICKQTPEINLIGIFSHEGNTYRAKSGEDAKKTAEESYRRTIHAADIIKSMGVDLKIISVGATPSVLNGAYVEGITEYRIGTYIFMDVGQSNAIGDYSRVAATVLATVISKPTEDRVILDSGAKALAAQNRTEGICASGGFGVIKGHEDIKIKNLFDEHAVIEDTRFSKMVEVGDKVEVIPSHICPTVNLYDQAYLLDDNELDRVLIIEGRGKTQ